MAKLRPRARLIRTIGDKLISGPEAAIIELVKNSYDAEASYAKIKIFPPRNGKPGEIHITDDGHGMTRDVILGHWLEPANDTKTKRAHSLSGKRKVLGAKGVGRFAAASLGRFLTLESVADTKGEKEKNRIDLDWQIFEEVKYLDEIDLDITTSTCDESTDNGVLIVIKEFLTDWTEERVKSLIQELKKLASPIHADDKFNIVLDLSEFLECNEPPYNFDGISVLEEFNQLSENSFDGEDNEDVSIIKPFSIRKEADYLLEGKFDNHGAFSGYFTILRGDRKKSEIEIPAFKLSSEELHCGKVDVELRIFDLESQSVEKLFERMGVNFAKIGLRKAREIISKNAGIGIYRNGFRIRPYGDPDQDWLKLEKRRVQKPSVRIGHGQVSGFINVGSEEESKLIERSSREGLENNGAFLRLNNLLEKLLLTIEPKRFDFRAKAGIGRKPKPSIDKARSIASLEEISSAIQSLTPEQQKPILLKIEKESKALTKSLDEIEEYQKLLESRAALGLVVGQVIHDGRSYLVPLESHSKSIIEHAPFLLDDSKKGDLVREYYPTYGAGIKTAVDGLKSLFKSLDPISGRKRGRPMNFYAKEVFDDVLNLLSDELISNNVNVDLCLDEKVMLYGYKQDLQSSLLNILHNAIYWISSVENEGGFIFIDSFYEGDSVAFLIKNNGPEIDKDDVETIFDAGFTLKSNGHGLGLSIAKEACINSKGDLILLERLPLTTFKITFPRSKEVV
ncbi:sensor histidine kinase [Pseudoalteromonas viridis]|uniref:Sensor histidine kinase n=2 Tax=Pseudoalteromonas viridis TaxID=339617 RepID=A0ABX7VB96_9GAMM|nr:sensor histidine kinase [Pseudoalteromonas viridis]